MFKSGITSCHSRQIPHQNFGEDVGGTENIEHRTVALVFRRL